MTEIMPWGIDLPPYWEDQDTYPDSSEYRWAVKFDDCMYRNIPDAYYHGVLKFCGCGDPDGEKAFMLKVLEAIKLRSTSTRSSSGHWDSQAYSDCGRIIEACFDGNDRFHHHYLQWLDSHGLLEHGGNVYGSWLTDEGESVLLMLQAHRHTFEYADE